jgi:hypothetical protein
VRYPAWFIGWGLACLIAGVGLGFWFMTPGGGDLALLPTHVHLNLFGWVTLSLYGLIHGAFPQLAARRLAPAQFWLAVVGGVCLPIGFGIARDSPAHRIVLGVGALSGATAAVLFAIMFWGAVLVPKRR